MLTLYDYLPSQNGWKVRQLLAHLGTPYSTELVAIFDGEGQSDAYRAINPTGAVPAIRLDDGRALIAPLRTKCLKFLRIGTLT